MSQNTGQDNQIPMVVSPREVPSVDNTIQAVGHAIQQAQFATNGVIQRYVLSNERVFGQLLMQAGTNAQQGIRCFQKFSKPDEADQFAHCIQNPLSPQSFLLHRLRAAQKAGGDSQGPRARAPRHERDGRDRDSRPDRRREPRHDRDREPRHDRDREPRHDRDREARHDREYRQRYDNDQEAPRRRRQTQE